MLNTMDISDSVEVSESTTRDGAAQRRGRGRPRGSRNKVGREAKEILRENGAALMQRLVDMALRRPVYGERDPHTGRRLKQYPSEEDSRFAMKMCVERLQPALASIEQQIETTVRSDDQPKYDVRQTARAILAVIGTGAKFDPPPPYLGDEEVEDGLSRFSAGKISPLDVLSIDDASTSSSVEAASPRGSINADGRRLEPYQNR